jgi:hypothetical protein
MDNLEFLDGPQGPNDDVQPEATATEATPEPVNDGPPRDEQGRFAAKDAPVEAPEPQPQAQPVAVEPDKPASNGERPTVPPGYVPVQALQELREEVRALKANTPPPPPPQPVAIPDPIEDPQGFIDYQNHQRLNDKLDISEEITRASHGDTLVDAARDWALAQFRANPAFQHQVFQQRNPWGFVVGQYRQQESLARLGDDPSDIEAFLAWKAAQSAVHSAAPAASPVAPPPSIVSAPSAGGIQRVAIGPGTAFDQTIR